MKWNKLSSILFHKLSTCNFFSFFFLFSFSFFPLIGCSWHCLKFLHRSCRISERGKRWDWRGRGGCVHWMTQEKKKNRRSLQPCRGCGTRKTGWREQEGKQLRGAAPSGLILVQLSYTKNTMIED